MFQTNQSDQFQGEKTLPNILMIPKTFWENIMWTDDTKVEPFGKSPVMSGTKLTRHFIKRTS